MIDPKGFYSFLQEQDIRYFTGVPDSTLKPFCRLLEGNLLHVPAVDEGGAVALAAGHYLATGKTGLVYMQNSGLGNAVNPITSLTDPEVYGIPVLYVIGWRGMPGMKDEPQHKKQGAVTPAMLALLGIEHCVLDAQTSMRDVHVVFSAWKETFAAGKSAAFLVQPGIWEKPDGEKPDEVTVRQTEALLLSRQSAVEMIAQAVGRRDMVICTTGKASRELYQYRQATGEHKGDFLTVGSMGHANMIALAAAEAKEDRRVWCVDGDGALLMHMGGAAVIGARKPKNLIHVLLNNGSYESVGGMPVAAAVAWTSLANVCGYDRVYRAENATQLADVLCELRKQASGTFFVEVLVSNGSYADLPRPYATPQQNKAALMEFLEE